jgi:dephospho-CoA kinase
VNQSGVVPVVGLLGGVGAGKSSVARQVATRRPLLLVDGDAIGHQLLRDPDVLNHLRTRFGDAILDTDGAVDRRAVGRIVFADDPAGRAALADLNALLHPRIRREIERRIAEARRTGTVEAILLDAAVMLESGWDDACDVLVFVETPFEQRLRNVAGRGWTEADLRRREAAQLPLEFKRNAADFVLPNDDTLATAAQRLNAILDEIRLRERP